MAASLAIRKRHIDEGEARLAEEQAELRQLQESLSNERQTLIEETAATRDQIAAEHREAMAELEQNRQALQRRADHVDQSRSALKQLRGELGRMHRETLEIRLATEELSAQLSGAAPPAALIRSLGHIRTKLADQYRQASAELAQQKQELEAVRKELAGGYDTLARANRNSSNGSRIVAASAKKTHRDWSPGSVNCAKKKTNSAENCGVGKTSGWNFNKNCAGCVNTSPSAKRQSLPDKVPRRRSNRLSLASRSGGILLRLLRFRKPDGGIGDSHGSLNFPCVEVRPVSAVGKIQRLGGKLLPTHSVVQMPGCCLRGALVQLAVAEHCAQLAHAGTLTDALQRFDVVGNVGVWLTLAMLEADGGDVKFADSLWRHVEHAHAAHAHSHASHTAADALIGVVVAPAPAPAAAAARAPPRCASAGTPAKVSGSFTFSGLSVLFSISTWARRESSGINFTAMSPFSIAVNMSTVVWDGLYGADFVIGRRLPAAHTVAQSSTAVAATHPRHSQLRP